MKHTPGPWEQVEYGNRKIEIQGGPQSKLIAHVWPMDEGDQYPNANARLIASTPELLEACKAWMLVESEMDHPCPDLALRNQYRKKAIELTKQAILKAEEGRE